MSSRLTTITLLAVALYTAGAGAHDSDTPMFSFSGFGTLGVVHSSEDQADFTSSPLKPNGAGYSHSWSADVDSLIGGQVVANFTPRLSAILQVIAEQNYDNTHRPHVEWANIRYQVTPDFTVRAGRTVLPIFFVSDSRKVGYSNPWVRPPLEVYTLVPISNSDGIDASYHIHVGGFTNTVLGSYGNSEPKLPAGGTAKARSLWGISNTTEYGPLTARIAYFKANVAIESVNTLLDSFRQFGPEGIAIADKYNSDNQPYSFLSLGANYDPGNWFVMGEWGTTDSHSPISKRSAWYVSGGYRLGKFTPYLTYAQANSDSDTSDPGLNLSTLPPSLVGPATDLNAGLNVLTGSVPVQMTLSVGGRWELTSNAAFKLQYGHTRIGTGSPGVLINTQPGFKPGGELKVISATIDFVF